MQVFRLVDGGKVDRMIAFDSLPDRIIKGIRTKDLAGLPRYWAKWMKEVGSLRPVMRTETIQNPDRSYTFKYHPAGTEPCCFTLDYKLINEDKQKWEEISNYLRRTVDQTTRLMDKIEDMAAPMAPDCASELAIEPEDIPVIKVPPEIVEQKDPAELIAPGEQLNEDQVLVDQPKKRGRPRKTLVGA